MDQKNDRQAAVLAARSAWDGAPMHIRAMAGAYVGPLLAALEAIVRELDQQREALELLLLAGGLEPAAQEGGQHGGA